MNNNYVFINLFNYLFASFGRLFIDFWLLDLIDEFDMVLLEILVVLDLFKTKAKVCWNTLYFSV